MERKIKKRHVDYSCGFPVILLNVPMMNVLGEWIIDINYGQLAKSILFYLAKKKIYLTGNEIRFIRYYFGLNVRDFALRFGVKHPAVLKWEHKKDNFAKITWGIEKDIRLFILDKLCNSNKDFRESYHALTTPKETSKIIPLRLDIQDGHLLMAV